MKTIAKVEVAPVYVDYIPNELEENKIYISHKYKTSVHNCLCGCKNHVILPLGYNGWDLVEENGKISFIPSILSNNLACRSHYVIQKNVAHFL